MALSNPLGKPRNFRVPGGLISRQARISQTFRPNALCFARASSEHAEVPLSSAPRADLVVLGCYEGLSAFTSNSVDDGTGGATDATTGRPQMVQIRQGIGDNFATGSGSHQILAKHVDLPCYAYDDDTLYIDDLGGTLPFAGFVDAVARDGTVSARFGEDQRVLFELFAAGQLVQGYTQDMAARAVATNLAAGSFSGGVLTATANGAIGAQDGVTLAVGDIIILPAGTLTTLVVSAANSGPYEVTAVGAGGAKFVLTRPAKWAHGALIASSRIRVGGEGTLFKGTLWYSDPATAAKVVGTDDPILYPEKVIQTVVLSSSAAAITNVPIKSATKSNVHAALAAVGGTTTSTIGYGIIVAPTPGGIGTATTTVNAIASGGTKNGTSDTSSLIVTIFN